MIVALWQAVRAQRGRLAAALALLILAKLAAVAVPLALKAIIDALGQPGGLPLLPVFLLIGYAVLRFASTLFTELRDVVFSRVASPAVADFTLRAFRHLHALGARFHMQRRTGGVSRDVDRGGAAIGVLLGVAVLTILPTLVEIVAVVGILAAGYSLWFTGVIAVTFVLYAVWTFVMTQRRAVHQRALNELGSSASGRLVDSLLNQETVKYYANERFELERQQGLLRQWTEAALRNQRALSRLHVGQSAVVAFGVGAVMLLAGQEVALGTMTVGDLVLVNAYIIQVCLPLNTLGFSFRQSKDALIDAEKMFALLDQQPDIAPVVERPPLRVTAAEVHFDKVSFGYEPARQILWDIDFRIAPGGTVAVVGGSGSGKSTLARLLFRFYDPATGRVAIDGQDLREVSVDSLRRAVGIVPQDTILFNETIAYNIGYGRVGAQLPDIIEAAKAAHIHAFIAALPEQYETRVGERGVKLSGGEKQRIAIARAMLKNPRILVFDEATSALDTKSERAIQAQLDAIARERTTLVIAHRLSTVINADEILVLEHGRIVERGRHDELMSLQGVYAQMWSLQQRERQLERTERRLALQSVNLAALAAQVIDGLRPLIDERNVRLYTTISSENARVTGDPGALQHLVWDLLQHAVAGSPPGGRVALRVEQDGGLARLVVSDGVAAAADAAPPIELLRAREVARQHHGSFSTGPAAGGGLERVLELPLRALGVEVARPAGGPLPSLAGLRILVIDDQKDGRDSLAAMLQAHGAETQAFGGGAAALEALRAQEHSAWPAALICDIALGEHEDGYGVIGAVRALEAERGIGLAGRLPAIALSGRARPADRMRALLAGFQMHLAKPAEPAELIAALASLAGPRPEPAAGPRAATRA